MKKVTSIAIFSSLFFLVLSCIQQRMSNEEKAILTQVGDISTFGLGFNEAAVAPFFEKKVHLDGSTKFKYEYELPETDSMTFHLYNLISIEKNKEKAERTFLARYKDTLPLPKQGLQYQYEINDSLFKYGKNSRFSFIKKDGKTVGNYIICQNGRYIYTLFLIGHYFDKRSRIQSFVAPKLNLIDEYIRIMTEKRETL